MRGHLPFVAVCLTLVTRTSSPSCLGQISLAASITVPVGPQQSSCKGGNSPHRLGSHLREPCVRFQNKETSCIKRCPGVCSHSKVDETEGLLQRWLFGVLVVGVSLFIKLCDVLHHLKTHGQS